MTEPEYLDMEGDTMSETTTGYTPTDEDVRRAEDAVYREQRAGSGTREIANEVLATIGPIVERERRAAKVEALREAAEGCNCGDDYELCKDLADEIERGEP